MAILGAGLAACFPVVMGYVADRYTQLERYRIKHGPGAGPLGKHDYAITGWGLLPMPMEQDMLPAVIAGGIFLQFFLLLLVLKRTENNKHNNNSQLKHTKMLAKQWLKNAMDMMNKIESTPDGKYTESSHGYGRLH